MHDIKEHLAPAVPGNSYLGCHQQGCRRGQGCNWRKVHLLKECWHGCIATLSKRLGCVLFTDTEVSRPR